MSKKSLYSANTARQISVFLDDQPGTLAAIAALLSRRGINIYALSLTDGIGHGYVRMVVDKNEEAIKVLREADELVLEKDVLVLELSNEPGSLGIVAGKLGEAGVNLEYAYCAGGPNVDRGMVVVKVDDPVKAQQALQALLNQAG